MIKHMAGRSLFAAFSLCAASIVLGAAAPTFKVPPAWIRPTEPFHIVGPIWYVGSEGLASYLIKTREGAILIDGTMAENVPGILRNIAALGVRAQDVRMLLATHAHFDHVAGNAAMLRATGARLFAGERDVAALESGTPPGEVDYEAVRFPPVHVTRAMRDGDTLHLGGTTLRAVATPGHTPGCTSWTMRVVDHGRPLHVVFACSLSGGGNILVGNRRYPDIVADYRRSFARMAALPADVVLPAHPEIADVMKHKQDGRWIQPGLLRRIAEKSAQDFNAELARAAEEAGSGSAAHHPYHRCEFRARRRSRAQLRCPGRALALCARRLDALEALKAELAPHRTRIEVRQLDVDDHDAVFAHLRRAGRHARSASIA